MRDAQDKFIPESIRTTLLIGLGVAAKLAVDLVVAASFGLSLHTDAFFIAYTLPLVIEALIYQACQSGLVPIFVRHLGTDQTDTKWRLFSTLFNIATLVSLGLLLLGFVGAPWLVGLLAPGIVPGSPKYETATLLMQILFLEVGFVGPIGVMRAFLNAHDRFTFPAMLELARGLTILAIIGVVYAVQQGYGIEVVAVGYVVAASVQFIMLSGAIWRTIGFGYRPVLCLSTLRTAKVDRLMIVPFVDYGLIEVILIAERIIGSFLPTGSISAISYGHRLASVFVYLLFSGIEVVSLSSLAEQLRVGTESHLRQARTTLIAGLRLVLILGIVVATSVWALSLPIVQLLFERGAFEREASLKAAPIVGLYALSIPFYGYLMLLKNYLFAALQPMRIFILSSVLTIATIGLNILLVGPLGAQGIAIGYVGGSVVAAGLGVVLLDAAMARELRQALFGLGWKIVVASLVLGVVMRSVSNQTRSLLDEQLLISGPIEPLSALALAGISGMVVLVVLLALLGVEELTFLWHYVRRACSMSS